MLTQVLAGSALITLTTFMHAAGTAVALRAFKRLYQRSLGGIFSRTLVIVPVIVVMFLITLAEAAVWACIYSVLYAVENFEKAFYFSTVTYTTLGYGDVVLDEQWRVLASFQAANGIIMFGWTTALIVVVVWRVSRTLHEIEETT